MAAPNTVKEALVAELLGDVGVLLDRVESVKNSLPGEAENAARLIRQAGKQAAEQVQAVAGSVDKAAQETKAAAKVVDRSALRFALMAGAMGLCGGLIGGVLVALAISHKFFGG